MTTSISIRVKAAEDFLFMKLFAVQENGEDERGRSSRMTW
jgi:hypothetical protein